MSTRTAKQLIYGALYIVIALVVCAVIYFLFIWPFLGAPAAVCTPSTCAPTSTAPIATSTLLTFITSPGHNTFLAQVANGNTDFGAASFDYEIDFYDASDTIIQSIPGQSFIYPNQNKYIVVPNVAAPASFDHLAFNVTSAEWLSSSTLGIDPSVAGGQFALQNVQSAMASTTVSASGQLVNTTVASYGQVMVVVLFKDSNGNIIGASQTELDNIEAGESQDFSVIYPAAPNIDLALNQIIVYAIR